MPNAARNGVFAAMLAGKGMTGPDPVFEGAGGLFHSLGEQIDLETFGGDGRSFRILESSLKHFPVGAVAQTAVE